MANIHKDLKGIEEELPGTENWAMLPVKDLADQLRYLFDKRKVIEIRVGIDVNVRIKRYREVGE